MKTKAILLATILLILFATFFPKPIIEVSATSPEPSGSTVATLPTFNWTEFWPVFHTYALWDLEWYDGSAWISVKSDLSVVRAYPEPNHCKITLDFTASHSGDYRLTFAVDKVVREYVERIDRYQYEIAYEDVTITFDWSDCAEISGLIFSHGVKAGYFWFRIRRDNVPLGAHVEIDPSTVGQSNTNLATSVSLQRKALPANGRFWVFYSDATNIVFKSSVTGQSGNWSSATTVRSGTYGYEISVATNGSHIAYAHAYGAGLSYRLGKAESNGTITWTAAEQTVTSGFAYYPYISFDTTNYPWIVYRTPYTGHVNVTRSDWKNGSWSTSSGFPYKLSSGSATNNFRQIILPTTSGTMYVIYGQLGKLNGTVWNGYSWEASETVTSSNCRVGRFSAIADSSYNIHLVFARTTTYDVVYLKRTSSNWGSEVELASSQSLTSDPTIGIDGSSLYVFWYHNDAIRVAEYVDGSWKSATPWVSESAYQSTTITSCYEASSNNRVGVVWTSGAGAPFYIKFDLYPSPVISDFQAPSTVYPDQYFFLNATIKAATNASFVNATLAFSNSITLKWLNSTNGFSEESDPNDYCVLDDSGSLRTVLNGTAYKLSWRIKLVAAYPEGPVDVLSANTKLYDDLDAYGSNSQSSLFTFQIGGGSSPGGEGGMITPGIFVSAETYSIGRVQQGTSTNFNATVTWTGGTAITISDVVFKGDGSEWLRCHLDMPFTVTRVAAETDGFLKVPLTMKVPSQAMLGDYRIIIEYTITVPGHTYQTTANLMWTISSGPVVPTDVTLIMTVLLLASLVGVIFIGIKKR